MGQQQITGGFVGSPAAFGSLINMNDFTTGANLSQWTPGATLAQQLPIQPPLVETWAVIAWAITFFGIWEQSTAPTTPTFGRLGKLIGGVARGSRVVQGAPNPPSVSPMQPLPDDPTALATLWDGAVDPPFPAVISSTTVIRNPITTVQQLPIPLQINSGESAYIGLWLTPSLVQNIGLFIFDATFEVVIDDGQQQRSGWGGP